MIKEAKDVLEQAVSKRVPGVVIVRSAAEVSRAIMGRQFPLVSLITNPGKFDDREAKLVRWYDGEAQSWKQRYVRGNRSVPILLYCWGKNEEETDVLFSRILPAIPRQWKYDGFDGLVVIEREEHSDHADSLSSVYASVAEIRFTIFSALEEEAVPTIAASEIEPGASRL
jgi:hypothetical protein